MKMDNYNWLNRFLKVGIGAGLALAILLSFLVFMNYLAASESTHEVSVISHE